MDEGRWEGALMNQGRSKDGSGWEQNSIRVGAKMDQVRWVDNRMDKREVLVRVMIVQER